MLANLIFYPQAGRAERDGNRGGKVTCGLGDPVGELVKISDARFLGG